MECTFNDPIKNNYIIKVNMKTYVILGITPCGYCVSTVLCWDKKQTYTHLNTVSHFLTVSLGSKLYGQKENKSLLFFAVLGFVKMCLKGTTRPQ